MKAIVSEQRRDGTYPEVGMIGRLCIVGKPVSHVMRRAQNMANLTGNTMRVQVWADGEFYKPDSPAERTFFCNPRR